jgi:hypothetical protein
MEKLKNVAQNFLDFKGTMHDIDVEVARRRRNLDRENY